MRTLSFVYAEIKHCQEPRCFTCYVVGDPAVSRLAALTQTTIPVMQQADVVLRKACPRVPDRNCQNNRTLQDRHVVITYVPCSTGSTLTLLRSIVLVGLAVALPYIAIKVIEIVGGDVRNAVQLKEFSLCGQNPENKQHPAHDRQATGRSRTTSGCFCPPFFYPEGMQEEARTRMEERTTPTAAEEGRWVCSSVMSGASLSLNPDWLKSAVSHFAKLKKRKKKSERTFFRR